MRTGLRAFLPPGWDWPDGQIGGGERRLMRESTTEGTTETTEARGRLAQMIATRGGLAPPEAPFVIEHREALIYMLCEAAELEHGIMCQYLFAAFTLKQNAGEDLTAGELAATRRWRKV